MGPTQYDQMIRLLRDIAGTLLDIKWALNQRGVLGEVPSLASDEAQDEVPGMILGASPRLPEIEDE